MVNAFWKLTVITAQAQLTVLGTEDVLRAALSEWREHIKNGFDDNKAFLEVEGLYDSADRAECSVLVPMGNIDSMTLWKM